MPYNGANRFMDLEGRDPELSGGIRDGECEHQAPLELLGRCVALFAGILAVVLKCSETNHHKSATHVDELLVAVLVGTGLVKAVVLLDVRHGGLDGEERRLLAHAQVLVLYPATSGLLSEIPPHTHAP